MGSVSNLKHPAPSRDIASTVFVLIHLLQGAVLLFVLLGVVPRYEKLFADLDVELPVITQWVIRLSRAAVSYWYLFVVIGAAALALDYFTLQALRRYAGRIAQLLWGVMWLLVPFALGAFVFVAIAVPMLRLTEALQ